MEEGSDYKIIKCSAKQLCFSQSHMTVCTKISHATDSNGLEMQSQHALKGED